MSLAVSQVLFSRQHELAKRDAWAILRVFTLASRAHFCPAWLAACLMAVFMVPMIVGMSTKPLMIVLRRSYGSEGRGAVLTSDAPLPS